MNATKAVGSPSDFHHITARLKIPLAPVFLSKTTRDDLDEDSCKPESEDQDFNQGASSGPLEAVNQSIASLLMKYIPTLGSVLVSYLEPPIFILQDPYGRPIRKVANKAHQLSIPTVPGGPWGAIDVEVKLLGWRPTIGQKLIGRPTLSSPSHLSLVIYQTFNATIHENHLKSAGCYYDLNVAVPKAWKNHRMEAGADQNQWDMQNGTTSDDHREYGCWIDADGKIIGGKDGTVSFTVISLTVANQMISIVGSLLDDPFSVDLGIPMNQPNAGKGTIPAVPDDETSSSEDEHVPNSRAISKSLSKSLTRVESPPPVKPTRKKKSSKKTSAKLNLSEEESDDDTINVERPIRKSKSRQKTPKKKKLKRSASEPDHHDRADTPPSSPPPPPPKRRKSSVKPKVPSTPPKKKSKKLKK